ncbi:MAG: hypothetical protein COW65_16360 [Cytophagales bacterium CG18_big_fil_WC_8_21_14_2_50_42_9]|nr:MAG: hypothetical protein COW65_16360 [Cytophagales bacterium CG18_big_fil_WC_8_21_14_2_50_42_9]
MKIHSIWIILFGLSFIFASCDSNNVTPAEALETVDLVLLATANSGTDSTSTGTKPGRNCNLTEVAVSDLPETITAYVAANYADATIEGAGLTDDGNYILHVENADGTSVGLIFDADGTFVSEKSHSKVRGTDVAVTDLPTAITDYISANYSGATVVKAMMDSENNYIVAIRNVDNTVVGLIFDATGTFNSEVTMQGKRGGGHGKGHR